MCRISLRFDYYKDSVSFFDIQNQIKIVRKELNDKLNNNKEFTQCELELCCIGKTGFCSNYKYNFFTKVFVITIEWSVQKPNYRIKVRCFDVQLNSYVSLKQAYATTVVHT